MQKINWELRKKKTLGGFTLIEVLVVVFVLSMGVLVIMQGINKTTTYISETAQRTIALNLAKEGLEAMYNIRNTNWRRRSDSRDKCWLKANPMVDEGNLGCEDDKRFSDIDDYIIERDDEKWYYYLAPENGRDVRQEIGNMGYNNGLHYNAHFFESSTRLINRLKLITSIVNNPAHPEYAVYFPYKMHFVDGEWVSGRTFRKDPTAVQREVKQYWTYRRFISIGWLYDKETLGNDNFWLKCTNGLDNWWKCWDSSPKELRFCSNVYYSEPYQWAVRVCSIMTNFLK